MHKINMRHFNAKVINLGVIVYFQVSTFSILSISKSNQYNITIFAFNTKQR
jgi:hypothetical protein